ncbi:MAG: NYN domain-containing protein [Candidatus Omnitrophica bacterium]|nr:NYN domain-containing protein [Candidatus Omnitrophota bacterium]
MKKIFILDGYNVIYRISELTAKLKESLAEARSALAMHVAGWKRSRVNAEIIIVFDGRDVDFMDYSRTKIGGIDCVFTRAKEAADDRIISMVKNSKEPSSITVISHDNRVRNGSRVHGARVEYPTFLQKTKKHANKPAMHADKSFSATKNRKVTDYYEEYLEGKGVL